MNALVYVLVAAGLSWLAAGFDNPQGSAAINMVSLALAIGAGVSMGRLSWSVPKVPEKKKPHVDIAWEQEAAKTAPQWPTREARPPQPEADADEWPPPSRPVQAPPSSNPWEGLL